MGLFQSTVIQKYINAQDQSLLKEKWEAYKTRFLDSEFQENIRNSKEEQYQEGFLRDLFVKILGYTLNPTVGFNLTTELKNVKDSKKADGGIIVNDKVVGVIELKGTNTTDLSKIEAQAFGYKNNQSSCTYVITSNFEKIRFYIDNAIEHEMFNLFELTEEDFSLLYLCLAYENIKRDIPKKIKNDSHNQEDITTKQLYKDYSVFKRELYNNLVELNPKYEPLLLFKKSQKLLDRFLFLFFAEDRHLLPPNSVRLILKQWKQLQEMDAYSPLYKRFKKYFGYLNTGHKGKQYDVYPYNGGLFRPDEVLDKITINDDLLYKYTLKLSEYDFASEVDVNILGHIFENSLNEIEEIQTQLEENPSKVKISKRKKDGVFYTPKYITKYIVENTIGKLCEEKKTEANLVEEDYNIKRQTKTKKDLLKKLNTYRDWLLQLTVVDPACGSGAFLSEALNYLIAEHQYLDELETKLMGGGLVFPNVENSILENNLFGVDINNESVEIAKLSLWLRTAQPNRKLNDLSNNIKCGNSLIDDPEVAGDKAFHWEKEFPQVFAKGGFDVVIGNPPYVRVQSLKENYFNQTKYLEDKYESAKGKYDLYALFMEKSYDLINKTGNVSFILPHKFLVADFGTGIRKFLVERKAVENIVHFGSEIVFADASTYTCIITLSKESEKIGYSKTYPLNINDQIKFETINYSSLSDKAWLLKSETETSIFNKISNNDKLKDICEGIYQGLITTGDDIFMVEGEIVDEIFYGFSKALNESIELESGLLKEVLKGQDINRYLPLKSNKYVIYPHLLDEDNKTIPIEEVDFRNNFPKTYAYLTNFRDHLTDKKIRYKTNPKYWYSLHRAREISIFEKDYLITPQLQNYPNFTVKETNVYADAGGYLIVPKKDLNPLDLLVILNSKLLWYFIKNTSSEYSGGYFYFKTKYLEPFGIPVDKLINFEFTDLANNQLNQTKNLFKLINKLLRNLKRQFPEELEKLAKKLQNWNELSYSGFIKELKKKKIKLSLSQEAEWEEYFLSEQQKAKELKSQIDQTDKEIDQMVYELYGLTDEEIEIVENS
ncbi:N-6 DNA methylase [Psychroflexus sp. CAK8W]|uniref:site-specific DNA-methyltransferase (adenine-specific) n=1 Tax=Psychroflexus longus TaxID=2873596 RepID=A0ABS7XNB0_9FLAO|nr:N-6 DNA methylase [Psychroflexus longus]MBZ9779854.1 N-6 DNA methylase [Psychroflexus longus]